MSEQAVGLAAARAEIIRNRMNTITSEAGLALVRASSSIVLAEAKDFGFTIADRTGRPMTVPPLWIGRVGLSVGSMIRNMLDTGREIRPLDQFICNDPHLGAQHVLDVGVFAPVFIEDELIAWVGSAAHHQDLGGLVTGWSVGARESFQEGLIFPPTRIVAEGHTVEDVVEIYLANVRYPDKQILDLKAQIAANNVARSRLEDLVSSYGEGEFLEIVDYLYSSAARETRAVIETIPNGTYTATDYLDHDVHSDATYRICCELVVDGERMVFDFSDSDTQADAFINCTSYCTVSTVENAVLGLVVPNGLQNAGSFEPIEIKVRQGTIVACSKPAANSGATAEAGYRVQDVAVSALSKALAASRYEQYRERSTAVWGGSFTAPQFTFKWPDGSRAGMLCMDATGMGGGARMSSDGLDAACNAMSVGLTMPNVESYEDTYPVVYVQRRLEPDTGGAGERRGGCGLRFSVMLHPDANCMSELTLLSSRRYPPPPGIFGGYPGASSWFRLFHDVSFQEAATMQTDTLSPERGKTMPQKVQHLAFERGDVIDVQCPGGGGLGDPLKRDPHAVLRDVLRGLVTPIVASDVYGVPIEASADDFDPSAATDARDTLRRERLGNSDGSEEG